jgi:hypothetical protein
MERSAGDRITFTNFMRSSMMKTTILALGTLLGCSVMAATDAQAQNYPWCAYYSGDGGPRNCGFQTFEQCQADVSGIGGSCRRNTQYEPQKRR